MKLCSKSILHSYPGVVAGVDFFTDWFNKLPQEKQEVFLEVNLPHVDVTCRNVLITPRYSLILTNKETKKYISKKHKMSRVDGLSFRSKLDLLQQYKQVQTKTYPFIEKRGAKN